MPRLINASTIAELQKDAFNFCYLVYFDFSTDLYLTDWAHDIVYDGDTYSANGHLLSVGSPIENNQLSVGSIKVSLSGVEQSYISIFLQQDWINRRVKIDKAFISDSGQVIGAPIPVYDGQISKFNIDENDSESAIDVTITSHWANFEMKTGRFTNNNSQQYHFNGDLGFEYAANSVKDIKWGRG